VTQLVPGLARRRRWGVPAGSQAQSPGPIWCTAPPTSSQASPWTTSAHSSWSPRKAAGAASSPLSTWRTATVWFWTTVLSRSPLAGADDEGAKRPKR